MSQNKHMQMNDFHCLNAGFVFSSDLSGITSVWEGTQHLTQASAIRNITRKSTHSIRRLIPQVQSQSTQLRKEGWQTSLGKKINLPSD